MYCVCPFSHCILKSSASRQVWIYIPGDHREQNRLHQNCFFLYNRSQNVCTEGCVKSLSLYSRHFIRKMIQVSSFYRNTAHLSLSVMQLVISSCMDEICAETVSMYHILRGLKHLRLSDIPFSSEHLRAALSTLQRFVLSVME